MISGREGDKKKGIKKGIPAQGIPPKQLKSPQLVIQCGIQI